MNDTNRNLHYQYGKRLASKMTIRELSSQLKHTSKAIPKLGIKKYNWWNEALHGVARAGYATVFPQSICMASTFDAELIKSVASIIGIEARAKYNENQRKHDYGIYKGLTMWSPNINIYRDPRWGRGHETYGEDPYLTSLLGCAFIEGLQGNDDKYLMASACAKHFCVHSGPENLRHKFNAVVSKKDLFETYLPAFKNAVIKSKVSGIMGAYNRVNGEPCCASENLILKLLREKWGFYGYFVSDASAIMDVIFNHHVTLNAIKGAAISINSGCELECGIVYSLLPLSVALGYTQKKVLENSVARLMSIRSQLGMFDDSCKFNNIALDEQTKLRNEEEAVKVASKGIVLLENDGILPLKENAQSILITGFNADNELAYLGNYYGKPRKFVMLPEAITKHNKETVFKRAIHLYTENKDYDYDTALEIAQKSDLIIVCTGLDSSVEGEEAGGVFAGNGGNLGKQGDRADIELPVVQQKYLDELIKLNKNIIILNFSGGCINFSKYKRKVNAIIQCWYPGAQGGTAIANILFGKCSPSGKLPITFYKSASDLPDFCDYSMRNRTYRYFKGEVQYPFGYGKTYTKFELTKTNFNKNEKRLSCVIKNAGNFDSDEVIQIYVSYPQTNYELPKKSLIRCKRFFVAKGKIKEIVFDLNEQDFYSIDELGNTVFIEGAYQVSITDGESIYDCSHSFYNDKETRIIEKCPL